MDEKGLTLVKLSITLAIAAITLACAFPSFYALSSKLRGEVYTSELFHLLNFTRTNAIVKQQKHMVCSSNNGLTCSESFNEKHFIVFGDTNNNEQRDPDETILRKLTLNLDKGKITWTSFRRKAYIEFLPSGLTYNNGTLSLCMNQAFSAGLVVSRSGRVKLLSDNNRNNLDENYVGDIECW